jgi:phage terminase large subunit-like protein
MLADGEASPEIYIAAAKEAQARICLDAAREIGKRTPEINKRLNIYNYEIKKPDDGGVMRALGSDSKKQDGLNISVGIIDEYHTHPSDDMYDILKQGCGAREQPVIDIITTAGYDKTYPCFDFRDHCIKVLQGVSVQENLFTVIYTIDEDDDWKDPKVWKKANPNWSIINQTDFKDEAEMAITRNSEEPKFKTKRLCVWTDAADVWVKDDDWMECAGEEIDLVGVDCWGGLDIAETVDINAFVLLFSKDDRYYVKSFYWIPEKKVKEKEDRVNYWKWKEDGLINVMPGSALDDEFMTRDIIEILAKYQPKLVAFDRFYSRGVISRLEKAGIDIERQFAAYGTGYVSQTGPVRELERRIGLRNLDHFSNPVMRWMCSNIVLSMDASGNVKFDKAKSRDKIDGMAALALATAAEMNEEEKEEFTGKILIL